MVKTLSSKSLKLVYKYIKIVAYTQLLSCFRVESLNNNNILLSSIKEYKLHVSLVTNIKFQTCLLQYKSLNLYNNFLNYNY